MLCKNRLLSLPLGFCHFVLSGVSLIGMGILLFSAFSFASPKPIVITSKRFAENYLLAEIFAQLLESRGHPVDRRLGMGGDNGDF